MTDERDASERASLALLLISEDVGRQANGAVYSVQKEELIELATRIYDVAQVLRRPHTDGEWGMSLQEALAVVRQHAIRWGDDSRTDDADAFDSAFDHDWYRPDPASNEQCRSCGMWSGAWDGDPCSAKAERFMVWLPINAEGGGAGSTNQEPRR